MFSVSQNYLSTVCKNQSDFNRSLELLSALSPNSSTALSTCTYTPEDKQLMDIWTEVFAKATIIDTNVKPLLILRCIQLLEYGFSRGWRSLKQLYFIQKIYQNFEFAELKSQKITFSGEKYRGFRRFYYCMQYEFTNEFPYTYFSFKDNLLIHFEEFSKNLKKFPIQILKLTSYEQLQKSAFNPPKKPCEKQFPKIKHTDLQPLFEKYLLRPEMSQPLPSGFLKLLSRRMNFYISEIKAAHAGNIPFKIDLQNASTRAYSFNCMAHVSRYHNKFDLYMTPHDIYLDKGSESKVFRSQKFSLSLNAEGSLAISYTKMVKFVPIGEIDSSLVNTLLKVDELFKIIQQKPTKINFIPRKFLCIEPPYTNFQMYEEWYNSSFSDVFDKMEIPEDFFPNAKMKPVSIREYFPLLITTAKMLVKIHHIGLVHSDIKPKNLLVRLLEDGQLQIIPTDFTKCSPFTIDSSSDDCDYYYYWDMTRKQKGTSLPYTDWYGLIITTVSTLIPKFSRFIINGAVSSWNMEKRKAETYDSVISCNAKPLGKVKLPTEKNMKSLCKALEDHLRNAQLTRIERESFHEIAYKAKAIHLAFDLLTETLEFEKKIVKDFSTHELRAHFILGCGSLADKTKFLNEISMGPALMETLVIRLESIHGALERYYSELVKL